MITKLMPVGSSDKVTMGRWHIQILRKGKETTKPGSERKASGIWGFVGSADGSQRPGHSGVW